MGDRIRTDWRNFPMQKMMKPKPIIIGIAGGSCSGKTRLAETIVHSLPAGEAVAIGMDSYYIDRSAEGIRQMNFDHPQALEKDLIVAQITMLSQGEPVCKPVYDYVNHRRRSTTELILPKQLVVIEGLFTLYWEEIRNLLAVKVFIELDHEICLHRRLERDCKERGRTHASVVRQYRETVRPMYEQFIRPTKKFADVLLDGRNSMESLASAIRNHIRDI
jgi:uridine kinase